MKKCLCVPKSFWRHFEVVLILFRCRFDVDFRFSYGHLFRHTVILARLLQSYLYTLFSYPFELRGCVSESKTAVSDSEKIVSDSETVVSECLGLRNDCFGFRNDSFGPLTFGLHFRTFGIPIGGDRIFCRDGLSRPATWAKNHHLVALFPQVKKNLRICCVN